VNVSGNETTIFEVQHIVGDNACWAQYQMLVVAIGPEVHNLVMDCGNFRVLSNNAELVGDAVRERPWRNCASYRAAHGSKQSKEKAGGWARHDFWISITNVGRDNW
jgi:hypothetical protein